MFNYVQFPQNKSVLWFVNRKRIDISYYFIIIKIITLMCVKVGFSYIYVPLTVRTMFKFKWCLHEPIFRSVHMLPLLINLFSCNVLWSYAADIDKIDMVFRLNFYHVHIYNSNSSIYYIGQNVRQILLPLQLKQTFVDTDTTYIVSWLDENSEFNQTSENGSL